jgi:hypothetical protein
MDPAVIGQVSLLLASLGAALQWARARKGFSDWWYYGIAVGLSGFGVWLATSGAVTDWRLFILNDWPIVTTFFFAVTGGNAAVSNMAKYAVSKGANDQNPLIPLTNSK